MFRTVTLALLTVVLLAGPTWADRRAESVGEYAVIDDGEGVNRCLFKAEGLRNLDSVAISHARISFDVSGQMTDRALYLRICPVTRNWSAASVDWTTGWSRPGGDFEEDLAADAAIDLSRTGRKAVFDVTPIVKEWLESGQEFYGFILTTQVRDGDGVRTEDLSRLSGLQNASLEVNYRKVLRPHRRVRG